MRNVAYLTFITLFAIAAGCISAVSPSVSGYETGGPGGGGMGATGGGAQDIGFAREVIAGGGVPSDEDFPVEGLLSEHDLPVEGAPCDDLLCVRPALGIAPSLATGELEHWVQNGMTSGLQQPYQRPPTDFVLVIDRSSSMAIDLEETMEGVSRMLEHLSPADRLGIVVFNGTVEVLHPLGQVTDKNQLQEELMAIQAIGSWDLMPSLDTGLAMLHLAGDDSTRLRRIGLMTCGYPSVHPDYVTEGDFSDFVLSAADQRIGTSVYGILLGYDPHVADLLSGARGGSFHHLESLDKVETVFDTDFDYMISPLAYDLHFNLDVGPDWQIDKLIGIPGYDGEVSSAGYDVTTAFLSRRKGAIFARLKQRISSDTDGEGVDEPSGQDDMGTVKLSYAPETAHGFTGPTTQVETIVDPGQENFMAGPGVKKGVALINQAEQMRQACANYHADDAEAAIGMLDELHTHLSEVAEDMDDDGLRNEVALVAQLRENMQQ